MTDEPRRALSLWQPWASAIERGVKIAETRNRPTSIRGRVFIHSTKRHPRRDDLEGGRATDLLGAGLNPNRFSQLARGGFVESRSLPFRATRLEGSGLPLPLGAVLCAVNLTSCVPTERVDFDDIEAPRWRTYKGEKYLTLPRGQARWGDYSRGRFVWLLGDVVPLDRPVYCKGGQGWWWWRDASSIEPIAR